MGKPGPQPAFGPDDVLDVFRERDDRSEPLTAPEVAERLGCSRRSALDKLHELEESGRIASKKVGGRSLVWWIPEEGAGGEPDVLKSFGKYAGTNIGEAVAQVSEEIDRGLRERRDELSGQ
jgi:predicted ArsR family transcriptional regulator